MESKSRNVKTFLKVLDIFLKALYLLLVACFSVLLLKFTDFKELLFSILASPNEGAYDYAAVGIGLYGLLLYGLWLAYQGIFSKEYIWKNTKAFAWIGGLLAWILLIVLYCTVALVFFLTMITLEKNLYFPRIVSFACTVMILLSIYAMIEKLKSLRK
jgi:hypothetical protein